MSSTFGTLDGVTLTSLIVALIALVVTLAVFLITRRQMRYIESRDKSIDAYALVQEFSQREKRFEERLVDQKVRLEILELRQQRQKSSREQLLPQRSLAEADYRGVVGEPPGTQLYHESPVVHAPLSIPKEETNGQEQPIGQNGESHRLVRAEIEALRAVLESGSDGITARQIQERIGRSREHTARMMNALFRQGLVERNSEVRPFSYTITDRGKREAET